MLPRLTQGARGTLIERAAGVLQAWAGDKSPATLRAYGSDLAAFRAWSGALSDAEAVARFLAIGPGKAHAQAKLWRGSMGELAPRTVARRLAMLRSVVRSAKSQGTVLWDLDVKGPTLRGTKRDTTGPAPAEVAKMLAHLAREANRIQPWGWMDEIAVRDLAVLYLLVDSGLRRAELCSLHVRHLDLAQRTIFMEEKGSQGNRRKWVMSLRGRDALAEWLQHRSSAPGPVFTATRHDRRGIVPSTVYRIVVRRARAAGFEGWNPHKFRHTAGTELARTSPQAAQHFLRHRDVATTLAWYSDVPTDVTRSLVDRIARVCSLGRGEHARARRARRGVRFELAR